MNATEVAIRPNTEIEEWLRSHGADEFELKEINLFEVDDRRSLQNQARFQPLDENVVVTYAEAMEDGAQFPPIVLADDGKSGGLLTMDGNHRYASARLAGRSKLAAYVVKGLTPQQITVLTFDANVRHGQPLSPDERKAHAVYLVETAEVQAKDAARMLGIPYRELNSALALARADRRLARLGIERPSTMPGQTRARLENIRDDVVFAETAKLAIEAKLGATAVSDLVTDINRQPTREDALATLTARREAAKIDIRATVGGRVERPASWIRLSRALSYATMVVPEEIDPASMTDDQRLALRNRIEATMVKLEQISDRLASGS